MRFIDASVFLYAFLKPKKPLPLPLLEKKKNAKEVLKRVNRGEDVCTSVVHLSEVSNILEARTTLQDARNIVSGILSRKNIKMLDVELKDYEAAVKIAEIHDVDINDALAVRMMNQQGLQEIYSFNTHFDKLAEIKRICR